MKNLFTTSVFSIFAFLSFAPETPTNLKDGMVEASYGTCKLSFGGKKCELAIRYKGSSYFVDVSTIKDRGDEHGKTIFVMLSKKQRFLAISKTEELNLPHSRC